MTLRLDSPRGSPVEPSSASVSKSTSNEPLNSEDRSERVRLLSDLDDQSRYHDGWIELVWRRGAWCLVEDSGRVTPLEQIERVECRDRRGRGEWTAWNQAGQVVVRREFTAARASQARRFTRVWESIQAGRPDWDLLRELQSESRQSDLDHDQTRSPTRLKTRLGPLVRLARFARARGGLIGLGLVLTLASTIAGLVPPYLTMPLVDRVLVPRQSGLDPSPWLAVEYLAGLTAAATIAWLLAWARGFVMLRASERVSADLRNAAYEHLQRLGLDFFASKRTGDLIARIGSDTDRICNYLAFSVIDFLADVFMIVLTAAVLISIHPGLALATLLPFPIIGGWVRLVRGRLRQGFRRSARVWGELNSVLADAIPGVKVVKAFAQEQRETERFRAVNNRVLAINDSVNAWWSFTGPFVGFLTQLGLLTVWGWGCYLIYQDAVTLGVLTAFLAYITRFYARMEGMIRILQATQRASASAERIFDVLDRRPNVPEPVRPVEWTRPQGAIECRGVGFRYGPRTILSDIELTIRPGEFVGLVGPSGAGKTTLISLICRFADPDEGRILMDGIDLRDLSTRSLRSRIGLVLQEPFLFHGTLLENLCYGRPEAAIRAAIDAAKAAHAHNLALRLPDAYDTVVGERGQTLSGGERQRVSLARAILVDPVVLILDEATSAVDTQAERLIQHALARLTRGRTTLAIAHRLSTLRRADRLVMLDQGRIVGQGTHDELLADPRSLYARLHRAQFESSVEAGKDEPDVHRRERATCDPFGERSIKGKRLHTHDDPAIESDAPVWEDHPGRFTLEPSSRPDRLVLWDRAAEGPAARREVEPLRAFPWSHPESWWSLVDPEDGTEQTLIETPADLAEEPRRLVETALDRASWRPRILRIDDVDVIEEESRWRVQTDRGPTTIHLAHAEDARRLVTGGWVLVDRSGGRFRLPPPTQLDPASRRRLGRVVE
ncbi:ABC transporter related protein [Isosphaera pallida ATCC 43644]|uniref:ABC transporter related protein n=1 Tax=Isosphaera pallida (strain ATCC 43644 / DSM 9630 / IS1B) TaxID=575540 RepID=E8R6P0_ISOPI|nr:ABC transporter related protein [Isosphaera pallida ATCC 43644]